MEESWENWHLHMEMDHHDNNDFLVDNNCHHDDDEDDFLRDILLEQPSFSSESDETDHHAAAVGPEIAPPDQTAAGNILVKSSSSNSIVSQQYGGNNNNCNNNNNKRGRKCSSPRAYILSFDNSTMTPATPEAEQEPSTLKGNKVISRPSPPPPLPSSKKRSTGEPNVAREHSSSKKGRNTAQSMDHIMAERKRRQELTEKFIALSATIPGLSKTDKATILRSAIDYVKQLQERVQQLEKKNQQEDYKNSVAEILVTKLISHDNNKNNNSNNEVDPPTTPISETSSDDHHECLLLPEIEARVMGKEVLIEIHCEKENGIEIKILDQLESLHLCVTGTSVLPFGSSALGITIVAQMGEGYEMTMNEVVKNLRQLLSKSQ